MKILLINIDSKIPNLALAKIEYYHKSQGDEIVYDIPLLSHQMDKIYISCVFTWNKTKATFYEQYPQAVIGGSGYDLLKQLPIELDKIKPKINYGFTTRGCIRKCPFCIVPKKEGKIRIVNDLYDIWDGRSKWVILLDNNILALPEHFAHICKQIKKENLRVDFNQGLDVRLFTAKEAIILKELRPLKQWRFAFDSITYEKQFRKAAELIIEHKIPKSRICVYVLAGFKDSIKNVLYRISIIYDEYGFDPFVMLYKSFDGNDPNISEELHIIKTEMNVPVWKKHKNWQALARWVNHKAIFKSIKWKDYKKRVIISEEQGRGWTK